MTDDSYAGHDLPDDAYSEDSEDDDEFLASRRRRARTQRYMLLTVVLALAAGVGALRFAGASRAAAEAGRIETLLLRAEPAGVAEAVTATSALVAKDRGRSTALLGLEVRTNLLYYGLYSGSSRLKRKAADRLEDARLRAPGSAEYALSEAVWHAWVGNPSRAIKVLDSGAAGEGHPVWLSLARAEAELRMGDPQ